MVFIKHVDYCVSMVKTWFLHLYWMVIGTHFHRDELDSSTARRYEAALEVFQVPLWCCSSRGFHGYISSS